MPKKTTSSSRCASPRKARGPGRAGVKPSGTTTPREPRNHRELAEAIFAECNAVQVGRELLESSSERGATVRARVFETLANWLFGKPGAAGGGSGVQVIWDVPRPPHESHQTQ